MLTATEPGCGPARRPQHRSDPARRRPSLPPRPRALARTLRRPRILPAGLALHLTAPLLIISGIALALRCSPDSDGMIAALILTVTMPVAAGAAESRDPGLR
ncbi:hypothetical protein [Streptomyces sp. NPDC050422]|uniref:hypothetical protein n=1 Tax=Streptomyces sp. NPDC050422 TaxID=3365614 RepID=UPI00379BEB2E